MCGICGVIHHDPLSHVDVTALKAMNQRIVHRGPDDEGSHVVRNVGLAMRRLSIIDVHKPANSRLQTKTRPSGSCITVKFTTTLN